jgi:hypothetical protein
MWTIYLFLILQSPANAPASVTAPVQMGTSTFPTKESCDAFMRADGLASLPQRDGLAYYWICWPGRQTLSLRGVREWLGSKEWFGNHE